MVNGFDVRQLLAPEFYDHPVPRVELIETHISWVFLAGDFVYKVKKPVNFGFLDFSTLHKRKHFCDEELRLNRRLAPQLYLAVVAIGGRPDRLELNGRPILEYAVKMRRFPQDAKLDRMLAAGRLSAHHLERFAAHIAALHERIAPAAADTPYGSLEAVIAPISENFRQIKMLISDRDQLRRLRVLEDWTVAAGSHLRKLFRHRKEGGFIRECHGDIHLGNMAWQNDSPLLFDCIEFNANLHWIDTMNDVAFLLMDLEDRDRERFSWAFLNSYLRATGDYAGVPLLNFYKVYRALVRVKVLCLRLSQTGVGQSERAADLELLASYLDLATSYTLADQPLLILTHGFSGSGKTTFVTELAPLCGAVTVHSDLERKRLFRLAAHEKSHSPVDGGIYSRAAGIKTYDRLCAVAATLLRSGVSVIIDATFISKTAREQAYRLARDCRVPFLVLDFRLAAGELKKRLGARERESKVVSEATVGVLDHQRAHQDPLGGEELSHVIEVSARTEPAQVAARIAATVAVNRV